MLIDYNCIVDIWSEKILPHPFSSWDVHGDPFLRCSKSIFLYFSKRVFIFASDPCLFSLLPERPSGGIRLAKLLRGAEVTAACNYRNFSHSLHMFISSKFEGIIFLQTKKRYYAHRNHLPWLMQPHCHDDYGVFSINLPHYWHESHFLDHITQYLRHAFQQMQMVPSLPWQVLGDSQNAL